MAYNPQNVNGQATSANSTPVVIASDQSPIATTSPAALVGNGSLTAASQAVTLSLLGKYANTTFQIAGTWVGTVIFESSNDNTNFDSINALRAGQNTVVQTVTDSTNNDTYRLSTAGFGYVRVRVSAYTSGTIVITGFSTENTSGVFLNFPIPVGANVIGKVSIDQTTPGSTNAVSVTNFPSTQTVTQATGTNLHVVVDSAPTTAVTGTFFQTTQPVSLATNTPTLQSGSTTAVTQATGTNLHTVVDSGVLTTVSAVTAITNALPAGTNKIGTVDIATAPAVAKGTQGANGLPTQDLKDSGRVNVAITCYQAAGIITTEALFAAATFSSSRDGATATTGQQFTVTTGKRFVVQSIVVGVKNTAAAAGTSKLVLRYSGVGGTITNTSPILAILDLGSNNATAGNYIGPTEMALPDGVELISASTFGFTNLSSATTMLHTITINGFEY